MIFAAPINSIKCANQVWLKLEARTRQIEGDKDKEGTMFLLSQCQQVVPIEVLLLGLHGINFWLHPDVLIIKLKICRV